VIRTSHCMNPVTFVECDCTYESNGAGWVLLSSSCF
jgi:hypothetical protein